MRIDDEVLAVLSSAETSGCNVTLTGQLDRKLYERTSKVLEAVTQRAAERIERGLSINMNHADYYTEIEQPKDQHD